MYWNFAYSGYLYSAGTIPRIRQWIDEYHRAAELAGVVVSHIFTFALSRYANLGNRYLFPAAHLALRTTSLRGHLFASLKRAHL